MFLKRSFAFALFFVSSLAFAQSETAAPAASSPCASPIGGRLYLGTGAGRAGPVAGFVLARPAGGRDDGLVDPRGVEPRVA
jgi:hypothetical protein